MALDARGPAAARDRDARGLVEAQPQLVPERVVDEKFIPVTYKLGIREPTGLPKYGQAIRSLLS